MAILVTGATGNVGRFVVARLIEAGERVRAVTRAPQPAAFPDGVEVVRGDLAEPSTLEAALNGVDRMYLFPVAATAREVVGLAKQAGVRRVVVLSSGALTGGFDTDFHLPAERAVEDSGLEWTHLRPGEFMVNKLWLWGPSIRAESMVHEPFPKTHTFRARCASYRLLPTGDAAQRSCCGASDTLPVPTFATSAPPSVATALSRPKGSSVQGW